MEDDCKYIILEKTVLYIRFGDRISFNGIMHCCRSYLGPVSCEGSIYSVLFIHLKRTVSILLGTRDR
ncbi:unnamed protein product [Acanthoscelides obtectus]|uniref:Uncharacterized protein n=1 Tax=Acanthoscelides obtectus TaxID=200917 RepID=A0A9P0PAA4_ACAOB|nr:unnamed protein product [Acanthoscelides obtectus]CAK1646530.1 hypothetical protein AOBTE_LOCUS14693 [Acanthoscelides obtectus]